MLYTNVPAKSSIASREELRVWYKSFPEVFNVQLREHTKTLKNTTTSQAFIKHPHSPKARVNPNLTTIVQPKVQVCRGHSGPGIGREIHFHGDRRPRRPRTPRAMRRRAAGGATAQIFGVTTPGPGSMPLGDLQGLDLNGAKMSGKSNF